MRAVTSMLRTVACQTTRSLHPREGEGRSLYTPESKLGLESWCFEQEVTTTILK